MEEQQSETLTALDSRIFELGGDILRSARFQRAGSVPHHGTTTIAQHSMDVARHALVLCDRRKQRGKQVDERDVVRAALLHDIGMTDEGVFRSISPRKAYSHPRRSVEIARDEYHANDVQLDAIRRHMWPICGVPPKYPEGWIVISADKHCASREVRRWKPVLPGRR